MPTNIEHITKDIEIIQAKQLDLQIRWLVSQEWTDLTSSHSNLWDNQVQKWGLIVPHSEHFPLYCLLSHWEPTIDHTQEIILWKSESLSSLLGAAKLWATSRNKGSSKLLVLCYSNLHLVVVYFLLSDQFRAGWMTAQIHTCIFRGIKL